MPVRDPWNKHLNNPDPTGAQNRDGMNRRGGGGPGANVNRPNRNRGGGGGGGGGKPGLGPKVPVVDAAIGLNAPATGQLGGAFAMGAGTQFGPGASSGTLGQSFSDKNAYESSFFKTNPEAAFKAHLGASGLTVGGDDLQGQWMQNDLYPRLYGEYEALTADAANQNLSWFDHLGNLAGVPYGQEGHDEALKRYLQHLYNTEQSTTRGYAPTQATPGQSRWLAY
jgi:hypothetical protein